MSKNGDALSITPLYTSSVVRLNVLSVLNLFHDNIKFPYEQNMPFLDALFIRDYEKINTTVFRKDTYNDLYLHWESFSPIS